MDPTKPHKVIVPTPLPYEKLSSEVAVDPEASEFYLHSLKAMRTAFAAELGNVGIVTKCYHKTIIVIALDAVIQTLGLNDIQSKSVTGSVRILTGIEQAKE